MTATIKKLFQAGLKVLEKAPVSGIIKAGIMVGVSAFTLWVMIKRTKKMRHEDEESSLFRSPVDEILSHNYVGDPEAFDDLDPEAQRICKKLCRGWKRPKKSSKKKAKAKKNENEHVRVVSLFDDKDFDKEVPDPPPIYRDTVEMILDMDKRKAWKNFTPDPKKIAQAKENAKKKRKNAESKRKRIRKEWEMAGFNSKSFREKLDQAARDLHLPVDDDDDDIPDTFRAANPALF